MICGWKVFIVWSVAKNMCECVWDAILSPIAEPSKHVGEKCNFPGFTTKKHRIKTWKRSTPEGYKERVISGRKNDLKWINGLNYLKLNLKKIALILILFFLKLKCNYNCVYHSKYVRNLSQRLMMFTYFKFWKIIK